MELEKNVLSNLEIDNDRLKQNDFLESTLWRVINIGLDTGIRSLLPDLIENQVIDIKNSIIKSGFKEGVKQAINSAIDFGKSTLGVITGNFENIGQAQNAIKNGGVIDSISTILDYAINFAINNKKIDSSIGKVIKKGKNAILNTIE